MRTLLGCVVLFVAMCMGIVSLVAPGNRRVAVAWQASPATSPAADTDAFEVIGLVAHPGTVTMVDLQTLPTESVEVAFEVDGVEQRHTYTGVRLWDVLERAQPILDPTREDDPLRKYVVLTAKDGYVVVLSLGEINPRFGGQPYLLAWIEDGAPLLGEKSPVQLVTPGDLTGGRYIYGVVSIEVRDVGGPSAA